MWLFLGIIAAVSTFLAIHDRRTRRLPNWATLPLAALVIAVAWSPHYSFLQPAHLWGGAAWWALPIALKILPGRMTAAAGDQKLGLTLGTIAVMNAGWGIFLAWLVAGVYSTVVDSQLGRWDKQKIPLAPGMLAGATCAWIVTWVVAQPVGGPM